MSVANPKKSVGGQDLLPKDSEESGVFGFVSSTANSWRMTGVVTGRLNNLGASSQKKLRFLDCFDQKIRKLWRKTDLQNGFNTLLKTDRKEAGVGRGGLSRGMDVIPAETFGAEQIE